MTPIRALPRYLLILDLLGSLLLLWDVLEQIGWARWLAADWQLPFYPLVLMGLGLLLITPYQVALLLAILKQKGLARRRP